MNSFALIHIARQLGVTGQPNPATGTWSDFVNALRADVATEHSEKEAMPAWVPARLSLERMQARLDRGERSARGNEVVEGSAVVGNDLDGVPCGLWDAMLAKLAAGGRAVVVHTSPSDGLTPGVRKGRVYALLDREVQPADMWRARLALATELGVADYLDGKTKDPARILFAGKLVGTPEREFHVFDGAALPADALLASAPQLAPANDDGEESGVHDRVTYEPGDRATAIVKLLTPTLERRGNRHNTALALGAALQKSGLGWSDAEIERVVRALPSDDPDARVRDALGGAARARRGESAGNWSSLVELGFASHVVAACEALANETTTYLENRLNAPKHSNDAAACTVLLGHEVDVWSDTAPLVYWCAGLCLAPGKISVVGGATHTAKSPLAELIAVCRAAGVPVLGHEIIPGHVVILDYETGRLGRERIRRIADGLNLTDDQRGLLRARLHFVDCTTSDQIGSDAWIGELDTLHAKHGALLVVVDSYTSACFGLGADANKPEYAKLANRLGTWSRDRDSLVLAVAHATKASENEAPALSSLAGTMAIGAMVQTMIGVHRPDPKDEHLYVITCARSPEEHFAEFPIRWSGKKPSPLVAARTTEPAPVADGRGANLAERNAAKKAAAEARAADALRRLWVQLCTPGGTVLRRQDVLASFADGQGGKAAAESAIATLARAGALQVRNGVLLVEQTCIGLTLEAVLAKAP